MKFEITDLYEGGIWLCEKTFDNLIWLGAIHLNKENVKNETFCRQDENHFNYYGIRNALCGKSFERIQLKRIFVIQMK